MQARYASVARASFWFASLRPYSVPAVAPTRPPIAAPFPAPLPPPAIAPPAAPTPAPMAPPITAFSSTSVVFGRLDTARLDRTPVSFRGAPPVTAATGLGGSLALPAPLQFATTRPVTSAVVITTAIPTVAIFHGFHV